MLSRVILKARRVDSLSGNYQQLGCRKLHELLTVMPIAEFYYNVS